MSKVTKFLECKVVKGKHLSILMKGVESKSNKDGVWGLASVEVPDMVGDIVRIKGISTKAFHNPPVKHMKILAGHATSLPNGNAPVIGRVEKFVNTTTVIEGKEVPALAFYMTFANTPLAKEYKSLMTEEPVCLDSFSVGMRVENHKQIKGAGLDIVNSSLYEISAVSIPCNQDATIINRLEKSMKTIKEIMNKEEVVEEPVVEEQDKMDLLLSRLDEIESMLVILVDQLDKEEEVQEEVEEKPEEKKVEEKKDANAEVLKAIADALAKVKK